MKTINIKIPLKIAQAMDDRAQLNANYMTYFISTYLSKDVPKQPIQELTYNYAFKVDESLHEVVKEKAIDNKIPMNEMLGRLMAAHY